MEKTALGLIAALGAVAPLATAHAAVPSEDAQRALHATSVAELLDPIPNALGVMSATVTDRAADADAQKEKLGQQMAYHHHHHHHWWRYHHHHHHHHWWHYHHHHHYW